MRCLYCGKELALLKRLTGGGEFCSDSHKQSYQEEYNRLALSRLLQAQAKSGESKARNSQPREGSPVAVEELLEEPVRAPEATEVAGFFFDKLTAQVTPDFTPFSEPWIFAATPAAVPEAPEWTYEEEFSPPPFAEQLFSLDIHPTVWRKELPPIRIDAVPEEFVAGKVNSDVPLPPVEKLPPNLPAAVTIPLQFSEVNCDSIRPASEAPAEEFHFQVVFRGNDLFELVPTAINFPDPDSELSFGESTGETPQELPKPESPVDITVPSIADHATATGSPDEPVWEEPIATPRAALAALSRLHQNIVEQQEAPIEDPAAAELPEEPEGEVVRVNVLSPPIARPAVEEPEETDRAVEPEVAEPEVVEAAVAQPVAAEVEETGIDVEASATGQSMEPAAVEVEPTPPPERAAAVVEQPPIPREADDLVAIPLRSHAPSKPHLAMQAEALVLPSNPLRPRLRALPLRPKVAVAPAGFSLPARTPAAKSPVAETKPAVPATSPAASPSEAPVRTPSAAKQSQPAPAPQAQPATPAPPTAASKPAESEVARPPKSAPKDTRKPVPKPPPRDDQNRSKNSPSSAAHDEPKLTFEALQLQMMANASPSFWGTLKFKLGLAVLLLGGAVVGYMAIGPSHKSNSAEPNQADAPGPSIMIPNGGWVQNWAGDTIGAHLGREITIYRPSLTLSDYRFQFQAEIETKSVGWVFRASDPNNYYAMKLSIASTALPLKISLLKYLVQNGKETEIGKAPLDLNARADTVYDIRLDVRGSKFYTFVQGQQVDVWKDTELKAGGVGFLNQRGERARIKASTLSYLPGGNK